MLMFLKAKGNVGKVDRREEIKNIIEPLFQKRFRDFFMALSHISIVTGCDLTDEEAHQCGHHIMNYLAHNPSGDTHAGAGRMENGTMEDRRPS